MPSKNILILFLFYICVWKADWYGNRWAANQIPKYFFKNEIIAKTKEYIDSTAIKNDLLNKRLISTY